MPLVEVLTRTYKRPNMLAVNQASLRQQTDTDWIQTLLPDTEGHGIGWSHRNMAAYAPKLVGTYIWVLDDDDECIRPTLFAEVRSITRSRWPEVIWLKMDHAHLGTLPSHCWGNKPVMGDIGVSAFIVRRDIWVECADAFGDHYAGDYDFAKRLYDETIFHVWHDVVASRVQRISHGEPE